MTGGVGAVVFDLFHTLADPEDFRPPDFDRAERVAAVLGVAAGPFREYWDRQLRDLVVSPDRPADRAASYAEALGFTVTPEQWAEVDWALGHYQDLALEHPRPEVVAALGDLRRLGLLSNAHERDVRAWERSPLAAGVEVACFSCYVGRAKPDPGAYDLVLEALGVPASRAAFVADGGGGELAGARRHGFGLVVLVAGPALRSGLRNEAEVGALEGEAHLRLGGVEDLPALLG